MGELYKTDLFDKLDVKADVTDDMLTLRSSSTSKIHCGPHIKGGIVISFYAGSNRANDCFPTPGHPSGEVDLFEARLR